MILFDIIALWILTCLFFKEQIRWRIGYVIWNGLLVGFICLSDYQNSIMYKQEYIQILPMKYLETLVVFCILNLLANSYLFKHSHLTVLSMTFLSLIVWLVIRMHAVLLTELLGAMEIWNHVLALMFTLILYYVLKKIVGHLYFDQMTILQQFVLYLVFAGSMIAYGFYMEGILNGTKQILVLVAPLLSVFFTIFIYTQKRYQAMITRMQATEEYVPIIDELVMEVRSRQHEFSNKLLAITSIVETADSLPEVKQKIAQFTDNVRLQPHQQQLLTMEQKIVAGFLYAKLRRADQMGIQVAIHFSIPSYKIPCEEADLVELLGILLDNALEASSSGQLIELVGKVDGGYVRIEVSNPAPKMTNEQMQKMFELGYSTKSGKRGFGLHNVQQIAKQYNAKIILRNEMNRLTIGLLFKA